MSNLEYYVSLLEDRPRIAAMRRSIAATVRAGDHVVDIGTGLGTFALEAARAGAARVTAVERDPVAAALAREIGVGQGDKNPVRLVEGDALDVTLERRPEVVIFEDFSCLVHAPGLRRLWNHVQGEWGTPATRYVPSRVEIMVGAADAVVRTLGPDSAEELPFSPEALARLRKRSLNDPVPFRLRTEGLAAPGVLGGEVALNASLPVRNVYRVRTQAARAGKLTGVVAWMKLVLEGSDRLDNGPHAPNATWPQLLFPFETPLPCAAGDDLEARIEAVYGPGPSSLLWRWSLAGPQGRREGESTNALPGDRAFLERGSPDRVPRAADRLAAIGEVCGLVDGKLTVRQIAGRIRERYGRLFADEMASVDFVMDALDRVNEGNGP